MKNHKSLFIKEETGGSRVPAIQAFYAHAVWAAEKVIMQGLFILSVALLSKLYWVMGRSLSSEPESYSDPKKMFVGLRDWKQQQPCSSLLTDYRRKKEQGGLLWEDFCCNLPDLPFHEFHGILVISKLCLWLRQWFILLFLTLSHPSVWPMWNLFSRTAKGTDFTLLS